MNIEIDKSFLKLDSVPKFIWGGDLSYCRSPRRIWRDRIALMKASGLNTITFYTVWLYHEPEEGNWKFSGEQDIAYFLDLIAEAGMYCIFRMGPFVHGEFRNGGLPQWLIDKLGKRVRTNDPEYLEYAKEWYNRLLKIISPRLYTCGGPIIMVQLENELGSAGCKGDDLARGSSNDKENADHLFFYYNLITSYGVDVPIIDINRIQDKHELMKNLIDSGGNYPVNCFSCDGDLRPFSTSWWETHERPRITIETGAGMFVRHYDTPPYRNTNGFQGPLIDPAIVEAQVWQNIAEGCNGVNMYIFNDGQNPEKCGESMLPERNLNYQAPITVVGSLRDSYKALKRIGWFVRAFEKDLLTSTPNQGWASATSYGIAHPGIALGGDLFEGYEKEKSATAELRHIHKVNSLGRATTGLNLSESNFLFMRNVSNHGTHWMRDVRVLTSSNKLACEVHQEYPKRVQMELPPQTCKAMPFFVRLAQGVFLEYSTATLLDRRPYGNGIQVIAYATSDETVETRLVVPSKVPVKCSEGLCPLWESPNSVTIIGTPGAVPRIAEFATPIPIRFVLLDQRMAGEVWDINTPLGNLVATSNLRILASEADDKETTINYETDDDSFYFYMLTHIEPQISGDLRELQKQYDPVSGVYQACGKIGLPERTINFTREMSGADMILTTSLEPEMLDGLSDLAIRVEFDGTYGRAWLDDKLISDHGYGRFLFWEIGLKDWLKNPSKLRILCENSRMVNIYIKPIKKGNFNISLNK